MTTENEIKSENVTEAVEVSHSSQPPCSHPFKPPFRLDKFSGTMVFDANNQRVLDVRGWGFLTGTGGLNLSDTEADKLQTNFGERVVEAMNYFLANSVIRCHSDDSTKTTTI